MAKGFDGSLVVWTVDTDDSMNCSVNELVKEPIRLVESLSFSTDLNCGDIDDSVRSLDNKLVEIDSM